VKASTLTPFDISLMLANSSGLWLYPVKATKTTILINCLLYKPVRKKLIVWLIIIQLVQTKIGKHVYIQVKSF
jgi:hypothetical protein